MVNLSDKTNIYQVGGSLQKDARTYVTRAADSELYQGLKQGQFCYVLNSRQVGKSSLLVRTRYKLEAEGYVCATIDLSAIGSDNIQPSQWYKGIIAELWRGFKLYKKSKFKKWWNKQEDISLLQKLNNFITDVLLKQFPEKRIVIFIDEIDSILSLDFSADNFFTFIRSCFNNRATDPEYQRFTFAIFGVSTPSDLIKDKTKTPFNIGRAIELTGFTLAEAEPLIKGFDRQDVDSQKLLKEILFWTGGQPFLTQKLCQIAAECLEAENCSSGKEAHYIKKIVTENIINNWESRDEPEHLKTIRNRIKYNDEKAGRLLGIYQLIWLEIGVETDEDREQIELILSGLVVKKRGKLRVKNEIYRQVFNKKWIEKQLNSLRPYWQTLAAWVASERRDKSRLLRGKALKDAQNWSQGKSLSDLDYKYIGASIELERKETQKTLEAERAAATLIQLKQAKETFKLQKRLLQAMTGGLLVTSLLGITAFWQYREAEISKEKAIASARDAKISAIESLVYSSQGKFESDRKLRATIRAIEAKKELQKLTNIPEELDLKVNLALRQAIYAENEQNILSGHKAVVYGVDISPDGELIISGSMDNTIKFWNKDGNLIKTIPAHNDAIRQVIFSPDGKLIASGSNDTTIKLWNRQGDLLKTLTGHDRTVRSIAFSPDGKLLVSGSNDTTIKLWRVDDGTLIRTIKGHQDKVRRVVFSPDGKLIASGSKDKTVKLWQLDGTLVRTLPKQNNEIRAIAFNPDGKTIVTGAMDNIIKIWQLDGTLLKTLNEHQKGIRQIVFSQDGQIFASASGDGTVKLWYEDGRSFEILRGHNSIIWGVAISSDRSNVVSASEDGSIRIWKINQINSKSPIGYCNWSDFLDISSDGEIIFCKNNKNIVEVRSREGKLISTLVGHDKSITAITYDSKRKLILSASDDDTVKLWQLDGTLLQTFIGHHRGVNHIAFSPDGKYIASGSDDRTVKLWQLDGTLLQTFTGHTKSINFVAFSPDGKYIASGADDRIVKLWKLDGTLLKISIGHNADVRYISFSPDSKYIATASRDKTIKLWKIDGTYVRTFRGHQNSINSLAFSPDGKYIASGSDDRTVKLWQLDGKMVANLVKHGGGLNKVTFSADGKKIISVTKGSRIIVWDLNPIFQGQELLYACNWVKNYLANNSDIKAKERNLCDGVY